MATKTRDGHVWTPSSGMQAGIESDAVISPSRSVPSATKTYDTIIIGAGYAGLSAARDLALLSKRYIPQLSFQY